MENDQLLHQEADQGTHTYWRHAVEEEGLLRPRGEGGGVQEPPLQLSGAGLPPSTIKVFAIMAGFWCTGLSLVFSKHGQARDVVPVCAAPLRCGHYEEEAGAIW